MNRHALSGNGPAPSSRSRTSIDGGSFGWQAAHLVGVSALVVAHPILDVIRRDGEFLVAHRASAPEVFGLVAVLVLVVPAIPLLAAWCAGLLGQAARRAVVGLTLAALLALFGLQVLKRSVDWADTWVLTTAGFTAIVLTLAYFRSAVVRVFASMLAIGALAVPLVFLFDPSIAAFLPGTRPSLPVASAPTFSTPIVMVVFDQFPLVSLLDERSHVDESLFPSLARLSRESTWYRRVTSVADRTGYALPAILTGRLPRAGALPRVEDHPENLFTWVGRTHDLRVIEPLTALCPVDLCAGSPSSALTRVTSILSDAAALYLHIAAPREMEGRLAPVNQTWRSFALPFWRQHWMEQRTTDRRATFLEFVRSIGAPSSRPALHFIHVLLPHEPYIFYPSGHRFAGFDEPIVGLAANERWTTDPWPVAVAYQRHLQQVRMVDWLVGELISHLKRTGLYDRALLVIAADHGACFRPGDNFKEITDANFAEIMSVPLFVKAPSQRSGSTDDRSLETIDILPTMADLLGASLPWTTDGASARLTPGRQQLRLCHVDCRRWEVHAPEEVLTARAGAVAEKLQLFGSPVDPDRLVGLGAAARLLGRAVASLPRAADARFRVSFDAPVDYAGLGSTDRYVPGLITGTATASLKEDGQPQLALGIDGTIRAVTRLHYPAAGKTPVWAALLPEKVFDAGAPRVETFEVVEDDQRGLTLRGTGGAGDQAVNLLSATVQGRLGAKASGFHQEEPSANGGSFRWTSGRARIELPVDRARPPGHLTIGICQDGPANRTLAIRINGCEMYAGRIPPSPWRRTFDLGACLQGATVASIELSADTFTPGAGDPRQLGVALDQLSLLP
jgi:hypothetical protein